MSGGSMSPISISSPLSASSPGPPALAPRAASVASNGAPAPNTIVTHKEWVVPPRPKPGRKASTETPPTHSAHVMQKRKAQNRAAQRAFRERKAARVNELEDKLKELQADHENHDRISRDQIQQLTEDNMRLTKELSEYKLRMESLQKELDLIRQLKSEDQASAANFVTQVASPAPSSGHDTPCGGNCTCTDELDQVLCTKKAVVTLNAPSVPLRRRSGGNKPQPSPESSRVSDPIGCGRCSKEGSCVCMAEIVATLSTKRPTSPSKNTPKRTRTGDYAEHGSEALEIDFTNAYMAKSTPNPPITQMPDPCGFCSDGTPCVCAEVANSLIATDDSEENHSTKLPPLRDGHSSGSTSHTQQGLERPVALYPPMNTSAVKLSSRPSGCQPGGCAQCQNDPLSTLFCQSVATKMDGAEKSGCCGGGLCDGDIEGSRSSASNSKEKGKTDEGTSEKGTFIPCSAAYQTLSRHRAFEDATTDLGSLVRPLMVRSQDGSCPQIEVSSIREVLRKLDRGFGSDAGKYAK
ncbi:hypothetical protein L873DRAFT_1786963 [Choiromyces venosus 120613-1]|uniref:BZIP domain-containing protein n=1 Tax=Choiromyces venosus 120613-1 TaxID=1336337 RepID=A0A3N4K557_9PEZI|nr:hypothetical protein L873DRAFT_1786963 [Choiromyces venosus 120613-1]